MATNAVTIIDAGAERSGSAGLAEPLALEVFSSLARLPDSHIVHRATDDHNAPLIGRDEIVVIDIGGIAVKGGWYPTEGGLFLIEYRSGPFDGEMYARHTRNIVQTFRGHRGDWYAGGLRRGMHGRQLICVDGPYRDEQLLADRLIGKVVGLYRPEAGAAN